MAGESGRPDIPDRFEAAQEGSDTPPGSLTPSNTYTMNEQALTSLVDNWINGNRTQARKQAKRYTHDTLIDFLTQYRDWGYENAVKVVLWLKGSDGRYQEACDATAAEMHTGR